ncbi:ACT domain-containing protein ACR12 isoform X2 [Gossypium australe]|uniref:ACT domain-containing protein ACR12 isoform X2 n=1 Tax=Gossypium australe TaxID=47621 RepID=A0A5B6UD97_9ROSI|nr:ACT domain-containing protein ACR12 isoform X2 [Gossypium australe]
MALSNSLLFSSSNAVDLRRSTVPDSGLAPFFTSFDSSRFRCNFSQCGIKPNFSARKRIVSAANNGFNTVNSTSLGTGQNEDDYIPMPIVLIDQDSDSQATVVQLSFGDRLGALIDTVKWIPQLIFSPSKNL